MIELGKVQTLKVLREKEFGVYLGENDQDSGILLPKKQVPPQTKPGGVLPAPDRPSGAAQSIYNEKAGPECTVTLHSGPAISVI